VHRVGKCEIEREIVGSWVGLVGCEEQKWFVRALFKFEFAGSRAHPPHVSRKRVFQEVLPRPVETLLLGDGGSSHEGIPREFVNLGAVDALLMGHENSDVVASATYICIYEELLSILSNKILDILF
jgi:hypothetical protein